MKNVGIWIVINKNGLNELAFNGLKKVNAGSDKDIYFFNGDQYDMKVKTVGSFTDFCKRHKGIGVEVGNGKITVLNDLYSSVPMYIAQVDHSCIITSDIQEFYKRKSEVDLVGLYEILLYGSGLYDRTILSGVHQMPAASKCVIDYKNQSFLIEPYWDYSIMRNSKYEDIDIAVKDVMNRLESVFSEIDGNVVMGISGGLDSRLSACILSRTHKPEQTSFFTFGYDSGIHENKVAKETIDKIWGQDHAPGHFFIKLDERDYIDASYVPISTGAQVGLNHSHLYRSLLRIGGIDELTFISNYYSDAVMGWDTLPIKKDETMRECTYYKVLIDNSLHLEDEYIKKIMEDLEKICDRYPQNGNFSCMNEFIYVTERNPKFHVRLSAMLSDIAKVSLPYADYELLEIMLSIPLENRTEKKIEELIIKSLVGEFKDVSSRRYFERSKYTEAGYTFYKKIHYNWIYFCNRAINLANVVLAKCFNYRIQLMNPYWTENQNMVLNRYLYGDYIKALDYFDINKILSKGTVEKLRNKEYRSKTTGLKYTIISVWKTIDYLQNKDRGVRCVNNL